MSAAAAGVRARLARVPRRELWSLAGLMVLSAAVVLAYVAATDPIELRGDMAEYHSEGVFFTEGRAWWTTLPFGVAHAGAWKAPVYPAWVGLWYELLGASAARVAIVQALALAPLGVLLTWMLGRRLLGPAVGIGAAAIVAVLPLVWEYYGLLYPEALAVPAALLLFLLFLEREPTPRLAVAVGLVAGLGVLIRPSSIFAFAGVLAAWVLAAGWRRGGLLTALAVAVAALTVLPWTIRNYAVTDGALIPVSVQDGAAYGTFNDESANDPTYPYAWRFALRDPPAVLEGSPVDDGELRSELQQAAWDYIGEHPLSVLEAFYWNGLTRFWDVRRPAHAVAEAEPEGRSETLAAVGIALYYLLLVGALAGLWRLRRRRTLVIPLLAMALAASIVFTVASATRYRAPLEPLLAILAVAAFAPAAPAREGARRAEAAVAA
jgi:4-amino-4-deoxy-L-arabinose transferase-like glycosyltransferase